MIAYPAPAFCNMADEDLVLELSAELYPGAVARLPDVNGVVLWSDDDRPRDDWGDPVAEARFRVTLGALRAWRYDAGQLKDEVLRTRGPARDEHGNVWVQGGTAVGYVSAGEEFPRFAAMAKRAIERSSHLRNALWLNGRSNRSAADAYMIHEYAGMQFGGDRGIRQALGISRAEQKRLTASANNLSPLQGGRHSVGDGPVPWSVDEQLRFVSRLLREWIDARQAS